MPKIEFTNSDISKVKSRMGVYKELDKNLTFQKTLKDLTTDLVERAFRNYVRAHRGATTELEEKEWKRFNKFLDKVL